MSNPVAHIPVRQRGEPRFPPADPGDRAPGALTVRPLTWEEARRYWPEIESEEAWHAMHTDFAERRQAIREALDQGLAPPAIAERFGIPLDVVSRHVRSMLHPLSGVGED